MIEGVSAAAQDARHTDGRAPRRRARRPRAAVFVLAAGAAMLPVAATASTPATPRSAVSAEDQKTVTWEVQPKQNKDEAFRPNFTYTMNKGDEVHDTVRVRNYSRDRLKVAIFAGDAHNSETGALDLPPTGAESKDIGTWIKLPMTNLDIAPDNFVDVDFTMKVPDDVESGDHVGGIVTSYVGEGADDKGTAVRLDRRLGTRVQVRVEGPLHPALTVTKLRTKYDSPRNPVTGGTLHATYKVTNTGNVRMAADQVIKVKSPIGFPARTVRPDPLPELLPGNSLTLSSDISGVYPTVRSGTKVTLKPKPTRDGDIFGADVLSPSAKAGVWSWPWALVVLLLALGAGFDGRRRFLRREQANADRRIEDKIEARLGSSAGQLNQETP